MDFAVLTQLHFHNFLPFPITYKCTSDSSVRRFSFLTAVLVKISVTWDVKLCPLVNTFRRFGVLCCLHLLHLRCPSSPYKQSHLRRSAVYSEDQEAISSQMDLHSHEVSFCFLHCSGCRFVYHKPCVDSCVAEQCHCCDVLR